MLAMPNWKDLFTSRDRGGFPEVVVPLAQGAAPQRPKNEPESISDRASLEEKGASGAHSGTTLTLEVLRAEVEDGIAITGHDTAYDRTFMIFSRIAFLDLSSAFTLP